MIIVRTPFRVSLFGGGTDFPEWFKINGGAVLGTAFNKYCYISVRWLPPFFEHKYRIVYSKIELVKSIDQIQHPVVRAVLNQMEINTGIEVHHHADLPAQSGLGSSSSFTVGLLHALSSLQGRQVTKESLLKDAIYVEQTLLKETVGCQDQAWAAYGGFNRIDFQKTGDIQVSPVIIPDERRQRIVNSMMLFFTGLSRYSSDIASEQIAKLEGNQVARQLILEITDEATKLISSLSFSVKELGQLLNESWKLKKQLADNISNNEIDTIYETALAAGAAGGKVLGSGGGGFLLFIVEPERQAHVRSALSNLIHVSVGIDHDGSKVVVYQPGGLGNVQ